MKRTAVALLALCILLTAGCANKEKPTAEPQEPPASQSITVDNPAPPLPSTDQTPTEPAPNADDGVTVYALDGGVELPIPTEYVDSLIIDATPEALNEHWKPLFTLTERASAEDFEKDYPGEDQGAGWLCSVSRLDRIGFEEWISGDDTGAGVFARDGQDNYYLLSKPTDVRFYRCGKGFDLAGNDPAQLEQWTLLNDWAATLPDMLIARNHLTAYGASELLDMDFTYGGDHVDLGYRIPGEPMDLVVLSLSQPAKQGEGGLWCVERVRYVYSDYDWTDTHLVFPAALGFDETAAGYYARLQDECDAGEHEDLLTPVGAALDYARRVAWLFGEDVSASDFEVIESVG
ncbi:MAG: hypothetical protein E7474_00675 [Ruminococcaceae bacterium]|nr:hypothetical protein [Oscillospiraceae bacterium]